MSEREPLSDEERELQRELQLRAPEAPRRSDAAFARAVASGVEARRRPLRLLPPVVVAACGAAALFVAVGTEPETPAPAPPADLLAATLSALDERADDELPLLDDALVEATYDEGWAAFHEEELADGDDVDDVGDQVDEDELPFTVSVELPEDDDELRALSSLLDDAIAARRTP